MRACVERPEKRGCVKQRAGATRREDVSPRRGTDSNPDPWRPVPIAFDVKCSARPAGDPTGREVKCQGFIGTGSSSILTTVVAATTVTVAVVPPLMLTSPLVMVCVVLSANRTVV